MRRRHGIPDNDRRPFNVAFAAVVRARQDHEATDRSRRQAEQPGPSHDQLNALPEQNIRQRPGTQKILLLTALLHLICYWSCHFRRAAERGCSMAKRSSERPTGTV